MKIKVLDIALNKIKIKGVIFYDIFYIENEILSLIGEEEIKGYDYPSQFLKRKSLDSSCTDSSSSQENFKRCTFYRQMQNAGSSYVSISISVHTYALVSHPFQYRVYFSQRVFYHRSLASCFGVIRKPLSSRQYRSWCFKFFTVR